MVTILQLEVFSDHTVTIMLMEALLGEHMSATQLDV